MGRYGSTSIWMPPKTPPRPTNARRAVRAVRSQPEPVLSWVTELSIWVVDVMTIASTSHAGLGGGDPAVTKVLRSSKRGSGAEHRGAAEPAVGEVGERLGRVAH